MSDRLSPTMRQALRAIVNEPGKYAVEYPGGIRTARALDMRGLVSIFQDAEEDGRVEIRVHPTPKGRVWAEQHTHDWRDVAHVDGCHWFMSTAQCHGCGAVLRNMAERDPEADPYSRLFMTNEDGAAQCARCEELLDGDTPKSESTIFDAAVPA